VNKRTTRGYCTECHGKYLSPLSLSLSLCVCVCVSLSLSLFRCMIISFNLYVVTCVNEATMRVCARVCVVVFIPGFVYMRVNFESRVYLYELIYVEVFLCV
jgi:uncharacterized membrane protein